MTQPRITHRILGTATVVAALAFVSGAYAGPITIDEYPDNFGGPITCLGAGNDTASLGAGAAACEAAGGYVMTSFGDDPNAPGTAVTSVASPLGGTVNFLEQGGTDPVLDALPMTVGDPAVIAGHPDWWQYNDHSSVYMTNVNWIELHFDMAGVDPVRAFSLFVGANFNGSGWIQGFDEFGNDTIEYFSVSDNNSPGFGIYGDAGTCSTITRIIVEPEFIWGVGNFAINQDPCASVPEPGSLALFAAAFLAFGCAIKLQPRRRFARNA